MLGAGRSHPQPALGVAAGEWSGSSGPRGGSWCQDYDVHRAGGGAEGTEKLGFLRAGRRAWS